MALCDCLCLLCDFGPVGFPLWASVTLPEVRNRAIYKVPCGLDILKFPTLGTILEVPLPRMSCFELPRQRNGGMEVTRFSPILKATQR